MAATYPARLISAGKKGAMVVVKFEGKSITRHVVNGRGKHPDDGLPAMHETLSNKVKKLTFELNEIRDLVAKGEKALLDPAYNAAAKSILAKTLPTWRISLLTLPSQIHNAEKNLVALCTSDPLIVRYDLSGQNEVSR